MESPCTIALKTESVRLRGMLEHNHPTIAALSGILIATEDDGSQWVRLEDFVAVQRSKLPLVAEIIRLRDALDHINPAITMQTETP